MYDSGGVLRWVPEWSVSMAPQEWSPDARSAGFCWSGSSVAGFTSAGARLDGTVRVATVRAEGLSRVISYAGAWFCDPLVRLAAARSQFSGGYSAEQVIGARGILRGRIVEFFVADGLTATALVDKAAAATMIEHLRCATAPRLGPVPSLVTNLRVEARGDLTLFRAGASPSMPWIVGVSVVPYCE